MSFRLIWPAKRSGFLTAIKCSQNARRLSILSSFTAVVKDMSWKAFQQSPKTIFSMQGLTDIIQLGSNGPSSKLSKNADIVRESSHQLHTEHFSNQHGENRVIEEWIHTLKKSKCHYGEAIFVLGPMGAGKSTVVEEHFKKHDVYKNYAYVDTDEVMEKLDGFDSERVEDFYPLARSIAIRLTDWLLDENISFIAEGTCVKYLELEDYMYRLKNKGYVIKMKHVNSISLEEILKRTAKRERKVPDNVVESIYYGSLKGINELKKLNVNNHIFEEL